MAQEGGAYTLNSPPARTVIVSTIQAIPLHRNKSFLRQKYLEEKLSIHEISRQIFSSRYAVRANLIKFGIELRDYDKARRLRSGQVPYGKRQMGSKLLESKKEQDAVERMQALRQQGYSYHKIAEILTTMGVPTKQKRSRWHGTTVMNLLKRGF